MATLFAIRMLMAMSAPLSTSQPFTDAITYLAAGERINADHALYALTVDDRPVQIAISVSPSPLLSPPPIAAAWRLLAAVPFGMPLWILACWTALLGATFVLTFRTGIAGALLACGLAPALGEQMAGCNVAAFFPAALAIAWRFQCRPLAGAIVGTLASVKLSPAVLLCWVIAGGRRSRRGLAGAVLLVFVTSALACGMTSYFDYVAVATTAGPSSLSLSVLTGIPSLSGVVLFGGLAASAFLRKWPAASFSVAIAASVFGTPALYVSGYVTLLGVLAPWAFARRSESRRTRSPE